MGLVAFFSSSHILASDKDATIPIFPYEQQFAFIHIFLKIGLFFLEDLEQIFLVKHLWKHANDYQSQHWQEASKQWNQLVGQVMIRILTEGSWAPFSCKPDFSPHIINSTLKYNNIGRYGGSSLITTFVCHNMPEISLQTCLRNYNNNRFPISFHICKRLQCILIDEVQEPSNFSLNMRSHPDKHKMQRK